MPGDLEITIASHPRWLRVARRVVQEFCGTLEVAEEQTEAIVIAVDEALSNVIKHAYSGDQSKFVTLRCEIDCNELVFEIRDRGVPFNPLDKDVPPPDELRPGGRGLYLMRAIMDEINYRRDRDSNCMRLSKAVDSGLQPAEREVQKTNGN